MSTVSCAATPRAVSGMPASPGMRGQRREPRDDLVLDARGRERLDLLGAAAEDERVAALEPDDPRGRACRDGRADR